jgi:hypothetical protein
LLGTGSGSVVLLKEKKKKGGKNERGGKNVTGGGERIENFMRALPVQKLHESFTRTKLSFVRVKLS